MYMQQMNRGRVYLTQFQKGLQGWIQDSIEGGLQWWIQDLWKWVYTRDTHIMLKLFSIILFPISHYLTLLFLQLFHPKTKIHLHKYKN